VSGALPRAKGIWTQVAVKTIPTALLWVLNMNKVILLLAGDERRSVPGGDIVRDLLSSDLPASDITLNTVLDGLPGMPLPHVEIPTPAKALTHIVELWTKAGTTAAHLYDATSDLVEAAGSRLVGGFIVDEVVQIPYVRYWCDGKPSRGPKVMWLARKRCDVDRTYFVDRWRRHALMAARIHIGMWRYAQNVVHEAMGDTARDTDGIAVTHYRSVEDFLTRQYEDDIARQEVLDDVMGFTSHAEAYVTEELIAVARVVRTEIFRG
jgi:hypothetical protein